MRGAAAAITAAARPARDRRGLDRQPRASPSRRSRRELGIPVPHLRRRRARRRRSSRGCARAGVEPSRSSTGDPLAAELAARRAARLAGRAARSAVQRPRGRARPGDASASSCSSDSPSRPTPCSSPVGGGGLHLRDRARGARRAGRDCRDRRLPAGRLAGDGRRGRRGARRDSPVLPTLADATAGNIEPGSITVPICAALVDELVLLEEDELAAAMGSALREHHLVIEGAAALALAASLRERGRGAPRDRARAARASAPRRCARSSTQAR